MSTSQGMVLRAVVVSCALGWFVSGCSAPAPNPVAATSSTDAESSPKRVVADFYDLAFVRGRVAEAAEKYIGDQYIQHNPHVADGRQAFVDAIGPFYANTAGLKVTVGHVIAEGDLVVVHALHESEGEPATAVADIFRVAGGKIVEHWDVQQPVPANTASGRPMV